MCPAGAVKITPAHDPNDFATGKRHKLEFINILNDDGSINRHGGRFKGQKRLDVSKFPGPPCGSLKLCKAFWFC